MEVDTVSKGASMKLTDNFVSEVPLADSKAGRKYTDGHGFYLHVKAAGKYWRMSYRYAGKQKLLALGVYPAVSLEQARDKASSARELLTMGVDPGESKKATNQTRRQAALGHKPRHPGAVLREIVLPGLAVSAESFAQLMNLPLDDLNQIINERAPLTCTVALKLERLFLIGAESWLNMQQSVDLWEARTELKRIQEFGKSLHLSDLAESRDQGDMDAANPLLVAKVVSLGMAAMALHGPTEGKG